MPKTTRSQLLEIARTSQLLAYQLLALHSNLAVDESNESVSASSGYCSMNESSISSPKRSSKKIKMTEIDRNPAPTLSIKEMRKKCKKMSSQEKLKLRLFYNN